MATKYRIEHKRFGHNWRTDDEPVLYPTMTEAELAALGPQYSKLEATRVVPVEVR